MSAVSFSHSIRLEFKNKTEKATSIWHRFNFFIQQRKQKAEEEEEK